MIKEIPAHLEAGGKASDGIAKARLWTEAEKKKRGLRGWGLMWGLAIFSIFLPLVHFVLVPAFFIAGPFVFFWLKKQNGRIFEVSANCPFCGKKLTAPEMGMNSPLRIICGACKEPVRVDLATS
ncbi:MAG: hypothetical protein ACXWQO_18185 [Bdellovibrionota bacterium]